MHRKGFTKHAGSLVLPITSPAHNEIVKETFNQAGSTQRFVFVRAAARTSIRVTAIILVPPVALTPG